MPGKHFSMTKKKKKKKLEIASLIVNDPHIISERAFGKESTDHTIFLDYVIFWENLWTFTLYLTIFLLVDKSAFHLHHHQLSMIYLWGQHTRWLYNGSFELCKLQIFPIWECFWKHSNQRNLQFEWLANLESKRKNFQLSFWQTVSTERLSNAAHLRVLTK